MGCFKPEHDTGRPDSVDDLERLRYDPVALQAQILNMGALDDRPAHVDNYEVCEPMQLNDPAFLGLPDNQVPDQD